MYGDSEDSDSSDDATGNTTPSRANGADSDEELRVRRMTVRKCILLIIVM
jgi:hypothetical protein